MTTAKGRCLDAAWAAAAHEPLQCDELHTVSEQLDTRDKPPRRLVAGETPGWNNWGCVYVDTGLEVPHVFEVDLDEGYVWQYVMDDDGRPVMDGQERRCRRLHGEFRLEPVETPITGYTYPSAELCRQIDAEADEELVSDGGARQAMQYLDRDAEVDREHTLAFPYLDRIVNEGLKATKVEGTVVLHLEVPDAGAFRKLRTGEGRVYTGRPSRFPARSQTTEASHRSQYALARAAGWLVSTRVLDEDNDDD